jgi:hypothetical protein
VSSRIPAVPLLGPDQNGSSRLGALVLVITVVAARAAATPSGATPRAATGRAGRPTTLLVQTGFRGFMDSSPRFWPPVYLTTGRWGALVLVPLLIFATGSWLPHRYEQKLASGALLT